jgi:uncharacterized protein (TIGR02147 family)
MLLTMDSAQKFLAQEYARRRQVNSRYSQRAFARQVGLSPGELSEILSGKRKLSLKSALRIAKSMGLTSTETKHLVHLSQVEKSRVIGGSELLEPTLPTLETQQVTEDMFFLVSAWYCFAILNLADCEGFRWDPQWIAKKLGVTKPEVMAALNRLERVGIVVVQDGKKKISRDYVSNLGGIPSESIRNYHKEIFQKASQALDFQSIEEREISGIGMAVDPKHIPSIKKDILDFQEELLGKYSKGKKKHVYQLHVAFFRLSQGDTND